jgi:hypothetical protein
VSFGEDALGNLYIAFLSSGEVYRIQTTIIPEPAAGALVALVALVAAPLLLSRRRRR